MSRTTNELFAETYNKIENVVEYNHELMANSTGYFNGLVDFNTGLAIGARFKVHTGEVNNRRIIGIVTPIGNAVFFERYTGGKGPIIAQGGTQFLGLIPNGVCELGDFDRYVGGAGGWNHNIGESLRNVINRAAAYKFDPVDDEV